MRASGARARVVHYFSFYARHDNVTRAAAVAHQNRPTDQPCIAHPPRSKNMCCSKTYLNACAEFRIFYMTVRAIKIHNMTPPPPPTEGVSFDFFFHFIYLFAIYQKLVMLLCSIVYNARSQDILLYDALHVHISDFYWYLYTYRLTAIETIFALREFGKYDILYFLINLNNIITYTKLAQVFKVVEMLFQIHGLQQVVQELPLEMNDLNDVAEQCVYFGARQESFLFQWIHVQD